MRYSVVYVSGMETYTVELNDRNYDNVKRLEQEVERALMSDDFWIDDIFPNDKQTPDMEVSFFTAGKSRLDQDRVDALFDDEDMAYKIAFLEYFGYDVEKMIKTGNIDDVIVWGADNDVIETSFGEEVPTEFAWQELDAHHPEISKNNLEPYFDIGQWIGEFQPNGYMKWHWVGDVFVFSTYV